MKVRRYTLGLSIFAVVALLVGSLAFVPPALAGQHGGDHGWTEPNHDGDPGQGPAPVTPVGPGGQAGRGDPQDCPQDHPNCPDPSTCPNPDCPGPNGPPDQIPPSGNVPEGARFCAETGHYLAGGFNSFWERCGGTPVFGFPLTDEFAEQNPDTGQANTVQYLERQRFEYHPEFAGTAYEVMLGRLGVDALRQQGRDWTTSPKANPNAPHFCEATGHAIAPEFWDYWRNHGVEFGDAGVSYRECLALFGYPISEPQMERNSSGEMVMTQWFERARFEYHPDNPDPFKVELGRLGAELLPQ